MQWFNRHLNVEQKNSRFKISGKEKTLKFLLFHDRISALFHRNSHSHLSHSFMKLTLLDQLATSSMSVFQVRFLNVQMIGIEHIPVESYVFDSISVFPIMIFTTIFKNRLIKSRFTWNNNGICWTGKVCFGMTSPDKYSFKKDEIKRNWWRN